LIGTVIVLVSWLIANISGRILARLGAKLGDSRKDVVRLGATTCRMAVLAIGLITGLGTMGVNVAALVAGLGLTGFALGFALKDALSNLLSGVLILVYQPFRAGDWIAVSGCEGKVAEINLRYTIIKKEKDKYLVPNSILFSNTVRVSEQQN
jgi:small-conductance mechanosensitive channel